jgi:hypothetical protein
MFRSFQAIVFNRLEQKLRILLTQSVLFLSVVRVKKIVLNLWARKLVRPVALMPAKIEMLASWYSIDHADDEN